MNISIFGLGYVGCVTGACLADMGHQVIGVDPNTIKVNMILDGQSPVIEKDLPELILKVVNNKTFGATADWESSIKNAEIALVCVGTPSRLNGSIDLRYIKRVCEHLGEGIKDKNDYFVVVIRSTVLPGTVEKILIPILEKISGKQAGVDFGVCMVPEFLREGSSVSDFYNPSRNVIGEYNHKSGDMVAEIFKGIDAPLVRTKIKVAEMLKYTDNSFHALKVTFANEIGNICKELEIDSHKVMEIFCMDTKLNLSPFYLKPGFAFGGSCLPKDLRAILFESKTVDLDTPVLSAVLDSNRYHIERVVKKLLEFKRKSLGFLGLSFKGGTDDLRESPIVDVVETMIGKGFSIKIFDSNVSLARLIGANREFIENEIPHISSLMCSSATELIKESDVIVVANFSDEFKHALLSEIEDEKTIIDLVRIVDDSSEIDGNYYGICW